jgi:chromosome partitioning protein
MRLAICSNKGGVGKTSVAANLAAALGQRGRTLAVDADPQDSLGRAFGVIAKRADSLAGMLADPAVDAAAVVRRDLAPGVDLMPAHPTLQAVAADLAERGELASALWQALGPVLPAYRFVVLDTHGDSGILTIAAVAVADAVLTPFTSDPGSALGAVRVMSFVDAQRERGETEAVLLGAVCANWDRRGAAAREVAAALDGTGVPVLQTRVPYSRRVPSATLAKRPVVLGVPNSPVAEAYRALAREVLALHRKAVAA